MLFLQSCKEIIYNYRKQPHCKPQVFGAVFVDDRASSRSNGVYKGSLPNGQLIAIKRAQEGSSQGGLEFKNEIELLSRVHDKNVVGLIGFCFDKGEQMLVYEYIVNGTLKDSLSGHRLVNVVF
ncbi:putative transferase, protein kinase RLK-Pelle-LRR-VIII-1 family [Helianthus annuus]|uniref:non-specific serine/threonine protein kinase n=1 Tax=Helianthus annuus TaxID=4232 RepID=A0A9K3II57_HELAN|nr:putative transferase, protein kinase RLK-Pelle-LRR-VIII-1 family [Helianthus annuus]KAJ0548717.1 putative transferase, protein kinase RLK-Pelle-LRR-VIII-1 family [Helianthus annuus]KAJ0903171.1 putative transferase, protein kinase RLK-Pelle-LRR-VIII-1 family [Helianthus annuus]